MRGCRQFCPVAEAAEIVAERWTPLALREPLCADVKMLTRVWMGDVPMAAARHAGSVRLEGPTFLVRAFPAWLRLSSFARVEGSPQQPSRGKRIALPTEDPISRRASSQDGAGRDTYFGGTAVLNVMSACTYSVEVWWTQHANRL